MAKKKSRIKEAVETVEGWVGVGPKANNPATTGPIRQLAQDLIPGAKERQARRKKRRAKIAKAVKEAVTGKKAVKNKTKKKPAKKKKKVAEKKKAKKKRSAS